MTVWTWDGLNLRRGSRARRAGEPRRDIAGLKALDAVDDTPETVDPDAFGAELPLGEEVADQAVDVRRTDLGRRHPSRCLVPPRKSREPIMAMHRRAAQDHDPVQGEQQCQGDWSTS